MRVAIITANTDIYKGTKADESGEAVKLVAEEAGLEVVFMRAFQLDEEVLSTVMKHMTDGKTADLILTGDRGCTTMMTKGCRRGSPGFTGQDAG